MKRDAQGNIIFVDFRHNARREEWKAIQDRVEERTRYFLTFHQYTPEQREQTNKDSIRALELRREAREAGDTTFPWGD